MKKNKVFVFLISIAACMLWFYRGEKIGKKEWDEEKQKEIKGRISDIDKPEGNKIVHLTFADGSKYYPSFYTFNTLVEIGDSLYKEKGGHKFIIYKKSNPLDTVVFVGTNIFYK